MSSKLKTLLGVADDDKNLRKVIGTFQELVKLSSFDGKRAAKAKTEEPVTDQSPETPKPNGIIKEPSSFSNKKFGISYTINLNLPATTEIEVYNSIFKALKEHLLDE